jgi:hypothetical protein
MPMKRLPSPVAVAPRPWITRAYAECAFPVDGKSWTTRSCCNPTGGDTYCPMHRAIIRGPAAPPLKELERELRRRGI